MTTEQGLIMMKMLKKKVKKTTAANNAAAYFCTVAAPDVGSHAALSTTLWSRYALGPFWRWENWDLGRLGHFPKVSELLGWGEPAFETRSVLQSHNFTRT